MVNFYKDLNFASQPQSFQDPVNLPYLNPKRPLDLKIADVINGYLPDKRDRFYVFNFVKGHQYFSPFIYIYAKRLSASSIVSDWLFVQNSLKTTLKILMRDLNQNPPKIIIVPRNFYFRSWQTKTLKPFFQNFVSFLQTKYHLEQSFDFAIDSMGESEIFNVYERN